MLYKVIDFVHTRPIRNPFLRDVTSELDIIALDGDVLVFVEVKTRKRNCLVSPEMAVDRKKMLSICSAANAYIRYNQLDVRIRFDIVTVVGSEGGFDVNHIRDAFVYPYR